MNIFDNLVVSNQSNLKRRRELYSYTDILSIKDRLNTNIKAFFSCSDVTDYDKDMLTKSTVALGIMRPTHTFLDETGSIGHSDSFFNYPDEAIDALAEFYRKHQIKESFEGSLSVPRGKNCGWPLPVSGTDRSLNNITLYIYAKAVELYRDRNNRPLSDLMSDVGKNFSRSSCLIAGERRQHTEKQMPIFLKKGGVIKGMHLAPRVRLILMSSKLAVIYNRPKTKHILKNVIMKNPFHITDKKAISSTIADMFSKNFNVVALDHSKFDQRTGFPRAESLFKVIDKIFGSDNNDFRTEMKCDYLCFKHDGVKNFSNQPQLPSGISTTTILGCIGNSISLLCALSLATKTSYKDVLSSFGYKWKCLLWGDDVLLGMEKNFCSIEDLISSYKSIKLEVDVEDKVRFLGVNYSREGIGMYPVYRLIQTSCFPESIRIPPLYRLGMIARSEYYKLSSMDEIFRKINSINKSNFGDIYEIDPSEIRKGMSSKYWQEGIDAANKIGSGISEVDSILMGLARGTDSDLLRSELGIPSSLDTWVDIDTIEEELIKEGKFDIKSLRQSPIQALNYIDSRYSSISGEVIGNIYARQNSQSDDD